MSAECEENAGNSPQGRNNEAPVTGLSTGIGGETPLSVDRTHSAPSATSAPLPAGEPAGEPAREPQDAVAAALAGIRQGVRGRGASRSGRRRANPHRGSGGDGGEHRGGYSGARPDDTDPQPLGRLLAGYVTDRGWQQPLAEARVFAEWAAIVGPDIAAHCEPTQLSDGNLHVSARSTAWATQLRLLQDRLLARLRAELGPEVVRRIAITGPVAPSWKRGPRSVRGRGPRDTYG